MASPPLRRLLCRTVVLSALAALGGAPVAQALSFMPAKDIPRAVSFGGACIGCDLSGRQLPGARFLGADFSGSSLIGANLRRVHFTGADFSGSDLTRSDLTGAAITGADFDEARLKDA
ncbi:MAG: pentapeptide repeat-containing protein, partial [Alphaproteobacteria bacterium]